MLSVILCTHQARQPAMGRVLEALGAQTLDSEDWELLVVDNGSQPALTERADLSGPLRQLRARLVREDRLGLTRARLAGFAQARGALLVLVDDDTCLAPDYLEAVVQVFASQPQLGAIGGRIVGEFESPPPAWTDSVLHYLAIRDFGEQPIRAYAPNRLGPWEPCGAGMALRRQVAEHYRQQVASPERIGLDRVGAELRSCGDTDLARCATDLGLWLAYEPVLQLRHLIPAARLRFAYLLRLAYSVQRDGHLLLRMRNGEAALGPAAFVLRSLWGLVQALAPDPRLWALRFAERLGALSGRRQPIEARQ